MKCRAMQALHLLALEPIAETTADPNSYGFRPERSTADAAAQCFGVLSRKANAEWILEGDIQGCFDNISHDWLIANIPMDKAILQKWLNAGYIHNGQLFPSNAGTPQGGIISPVLSNMTLDGLEAMLAKRFPTAKWTGKKLQAVRYADDFIITGYSKEWLENEVRPAVVEFLAERGLTLSKDKTKITLIGNGFDFLVQRQALDQAFQGEYQRSPCQATRVDQGQQNDTADQSDRFAQPGSTGLGELSQSCRRQEGLQPGGQCSVGNALAMGGTSPPSQDTPMGEGSVFQSTRGAPLGVLVY